MAAPLVGLAAKAAANPKAAAGLLHKLWNDYGPLALKGFLAIWLAGTLIVFAPALSLLYLVWGSVLGVPISAQCGEQLPSANAVKMDPSNAGGDRLANAKTIIAVGKGMGIPPRGWVVAIATALQESGLRNLNYGDRDSQGLFQQRPSAGWGTVAQIRTPTYAATKFYEALKRVKGWESMPITVAAQKVQISAFPSAYAKWEGAANKFVQQLGGTTGAISPAGGAAGAECAGGYGGDAGSFPKNPDHPNPRSPAEAVAWAKAHLGAGGWSNRCLAFVAHAYGWGGAGMVGGTAYAVDNYYAQPNNFKHDKDRNPPVGALLYWKTSNPAGHVAMYVGNGQVITTTGTVVKQMSWKEIDGWGPYLGWSPPYFPAGWGRD